MKIYTVELNQYLFNEATMCDDIKISQTVEIMAENEEELWETLYNDYYYENAELIGYNSL